MVNTFVDNINIIKGKYLDEGWPEAGGNEKTNLADGGFPFALEFKLKGRVKKNCEKAVRLPALRGGGGVPPPQPDHFYL